MQMRNTWGFLGRQDVEQGIFMVVVVSFFETLILFFFNFDHDVSEISCL